MGHDHSHGPTGLDPNSRAGARYAKRLAITLGLVVVFLVVQVVGGILTGSLALLSDAGHMATDAVGIAMAMAAIHLASRPDRRDHRTFGLYRLEILAALANSMLLIGVAIWVVYEAINRIGDEPEIPAGWVLVVGAVGLAVNVVGFLLLRGGAEESLNIRGAYLEVLADLIGSVAVVLGALIIAVTGYNWIDSIVGVALAVFIVPRAIKLGRDTLRVIIQAAPPHIDVGEVTAQLEEIDGVVGVHDFHVWTLTSDMDVLTAHIMTTIETEPHAVLDQAREMLSEQHGIHHATLQVEPETHKGCEELTW
jgi:cobalt-zinc-cadmium efflux system protein